MGVVLAKFRKEKTTFEILENLEKQIKEIEEYSVTTQAKQKRFVGNFLVISIGLYVIGFLIFYFVFFPPTWMERITYSVPLLIFPLIIFLLRRLLAWFFQRKLNKNSSKLNTLRAEKKKTLEKVMDKETYKVAIEILNRFGDKSNNYYRSAAAEMSPRVAPRKPVAPQLTVSTTGDQQLTNRLTPGNPRATPSPTTPLRSTQAPAQLASMQLSAQRQVPAASPSPAAYRVGLQAPRARTPFPVINQQTKGVVEKLVDYLIGDGPQNRFAMICKECYGHNGMALQEEYEYATFRCAFCSALNPSRKSRPIAPKLPNAARVGAPMIAGSNLSDSSDSTSTSEKNSGSDSDDERILPPKPASQAPSDAVETISNEGEAVDDGLSSSPAATANNNNDSSAEVSSEKPSEEKKND